MEEIDIEQIANEAVEASQRLGWDDYQVLFFMAVLAGITATVCAKFDRRYRDFGDLFFIGLLGGLAGLFCCAVYARFIGGVFVDELGLLGVSLASGFVGRAGVYIVIEQLGKKLGFDFGDLRSTIRRDEARKASRGGKAPEATGFDNGDQVNPE